jgi:hypothetical protein
LISQAFRIGRRLHQLAAAAAGAMQCNAMIPKVIT